MGANDGTGVRGAALADKQAICAGGGCTVGGAAAKRQAIGKVNLLSGRVTGGSGEVGSATGLGVSAAEIAGIGPEGNDEKGGDNCKDEKQRLFDGPESHELSLA